MYYIRNVVVHWTYSKLSLNPGQVVKHERARIISETERIRIGGLQRDPLFTHCISQDGRLFKIGDVGPQIHLAIIGGLNEEYQYANTATRDQLHTLANIIRFHLSMGGTVEAGDLKNWDFETWLKAIKP